MSKLSGSNPPAFFCDGKVSFNSHVIARRAAARRRNRMAYMCPKCRTWHVGTRKPKLK
jgi:hypothetical protein